MGTDVCCTSYQLYIMYRYIWKTSHRLWKQINDNGMSIFRSVDVLVCRRFGLSTFWFVDVLVCRRFGLWTFWSVDVLVCRRFGLSMFWLVDVLVCRRFGLSTFRFVDVLVVDVSVCRRFGLSTFWPVTAQPLRRCSWGSILLACGGKMMNAWQYSTIVNQNASGFLEYPEFIRFQTNLKSVMLPLKTHVPLKSCMEIEQGLLSDSNFIPCLNSLTVNIWKIIAFSWQLISSRSLAILLWFMWNYKFCGNCLYITAGFAFEMLHKPGAVGYHCILVSYKRI